MKARRIIINHRGIIVGEMMNNLLEIGIFILIEIILNRIVNLAFRIMSKKHNTVHLRF